MEERLGPVKELSTAVWQELLRTRQGLGALNLIQKLTGCRLHLQRNASHVRLFGSAHAGAMASTLLEHLEEMCSEAQVEAPADKLTQNILDNIACHTCVTLRTQGSKLCLTGFKTAIQDAMAEIEKVISSPDLIPRDMGDPSSANTREAYHLAPMLRFATNVQSPSYNPQQVAVGRSDANIGSPGGVSCVSGASTALCSGQAAVAGNSVPHFGQCRWEPPSSQQR